MSRTSLCTRLCARCPRYLLGIALCATQAFSQAPAAAVPVERAFHTPKAEVDSALRSLQSASGGRLPTVDGFVNQQTQPLERFQRPHYTYSIQVVSKPPADSVVRIRARITAWFADSNPARSGYRELPSNGRLESDLLERLEEVLSQGATAAQAPSSQSASSSSQINPASPKLPSAPRNSLFLSPRPGATILPPRSEAAESTSGPKGSANYAQELREQASNLEEVLRNQTHPTDLAAVKQSRTPVYSRPSEEGQVLFLAEAEDEFQVLNTSSEWVHVQISGLSRGWIRGQALELPSRATKPTPAAAASTGSVGAVGEQPFRLQRQEVNTFPGDWAPLRGKPVRIMSLDPVGTGTSTPAQKWKMARAMFQRAAARADLQPNSQQLSHSGGRGADLRFRGRGNGVSDAYDFAGMERRALDG